MAVLTTTGLVGDMQKAAEGLAGDIWGQMKTYAGPELEKIATQIVAIQVHQDDYTPDGARALMQMQIHATVAVFVGMTTLTMLDVQKALNTILSAIKTTVNTALKFSLL